jgi:tRNA/tmRNA/rRNA uracil-C5-methylase (TrmA/RlmC/RlmD family)
MTAPNLQLGQLVELDITDIAFGGDGIGRVENFVVFVPFVIEGERVEAEIVEVKRRYALADLVRVITPSPKRVEPRCPYYRKCAGCQYQHIEYARQLELKRKQIRDIFQRIGGIAEPPVEPVVASPREYGYRNKLVVHGPGKPGFWTVRGRSIIHVEKCPIARDEISQKLTESRELVKDLVIRRTSDGKIFTFSEPAPDEIVEEIVLGRTFRVPLGAFFQVNSDIIALVLEHVRNIFSASGCKILVDAYCGVGLFALTLADIAQRVYGIEFDAKAASAAQENAKNFGFAHCDFYAGKTERLLLYTLRQCKLEETCLILDPPRSGCGKAVLKTLQKSRPKKIVYVSCAPPTLARDVKELVAAGYELENITPFDMFPQTQHCEAVAELRWR